VNGVRVLAGGAHTGHAGRVLHGPGRAQDNTEEGDRDGSDRRRRAGARAVVTGRGERYRARTGERFGAERMRVVMGTSRTALLRPRTCSLAGALRCCRSSRRRLSAEQVEALRDARWRRSAPCTSSATNAGIAFGGQRCGRSRRRSGTGCWASTSARHQRRPRVRAGAARAGRGTRLNTASLAGLTSGILGAYRSRSTRSWRCPSRCTSSFQQRERRGRVGALPRLGPHPHR